jgi:hypothetical protein
LGFYVFSDKNKRAIKPLQFVTGSMALGSQALGSMQYSLRYRAYMLCIGMACFVPSYLAGLGKVLSRSAGSSTTFFR